MPLTIVGYVPILDIEVSAVAQVSDCPNWHIIMEPRLTVLLPIITTAPEGGTEIGVSPTVAIWFWEIVIEPPIIIAEDAADIITVESPMTIELIGWAGFDGWDGWDKGFGISGDAGFEGFWGGGVESGGLGDELWSGVDNRAEFIGAGWALKDGASELLSIIGVGCSNEELEDDAGELSAVGSETDTFEGITEALVEAGVGWSGVGDGSGAVDWLISGSSLTVLITGSAVVCVR